MVLVSVILGQILDARLISVTRNRYPGAMSDTESYIYRYSWDKEDLKEYKWDEHYVKQDGVLSSIHELLCWH